MRSQVFSVAAAAAAAAVAMLLVARRRRRSRDAAATDADAGAVATTAPTPTDAASFMSPTRSQSIDCFPAYPVEQDASEDASPSLIIGIAGGSASGKSFFASTLRDRCNRIPGCFCVTLSHDNYYKDKPQVDAECAGNWDCPEALHTSELVRDLERLQQGGHVRLPHYDFSVSARDSERATDVRPPPRSEGQLVVILVEGMMIFHDEELCDACHLRVFIDCDEDTRFMRRLSRDTDDSSGGRGRSVQSVYRQWSDIVKPAHMKYIEPTSASRTWSCRRAA